MTGLELPNPVESAALAAPSSPALVHGDTVLSWSTLRDRVAAAAGVLSAQGVRAGSRVAVRTPLSLEGIVALHAVGWLGAVAVPLEADATPLREAERVERLRATVIVDPHGAAPGARPVLSLRGSSAPAPERAWPLDEVRLALWTSGTTGEPKVVELTTGQLAFAAFGSAMRLGHLPGDRWLCCLPLHHVGGLSILFRAAWGAAAAELLPRFDAAEAAAALERATLASLVPRQLEAVLDARGDRQPPPRLRAILLGGDRASPALLARAERSGLPIAVTWGMTESAAQLATGFDLRAAREGIVGPPLAFVRVHTEDSGRLVAQGPQLAGGRLETSDRGEILADGRVRVTGRVDDVFISGGENVDPRRVERALERLPAVREALVRGAPDPAWGRRTEALLVPSGAERPELDAIATALAPELSAAERPRAIRWVDALPRTALGKLARDPGAWSAPTEHEGTSADARSGTPKEPR